MKIRDQSLGSVLGIPSRVLEVHRQIEATWLAMLICIKIVHIDSIVSCASSCWLTFYKWEGEKRSMKQCVVFAIKPISSILLTRQNHKEINLY